MRHSLAARILLLVAGSVIALAIAEALIVTSIGEQQIRSLVRSDVQSTGATLQQILRERVESMTEQVNLLASQSILKGYFQQPDNQSTFQDLAQTYAAQIGVSRMVMTDRDGKLLADTAASDASQALDYDRIGTADALNSNTWAGIVSTRSGIDLAVTVPIVIGPDVWGTMSAFSPIDSRLASDLSEAAGGNQVLFLNGNQVVGSSDPSIHVRPQNLGDPVLVKAGRNEYFAVQAKFPYAQPQDPFQFVVLRKYGPAMVVFTRLRNWFLAVSALVLLLVLSIGLGLTRRVTKSLSCVVHAAETVKQGRWPKPFSSYENDEIGILKSAFDEMMEAIHEADEKIRSGSLATIQALAAAVDAKDAYTKGHSSRVAEGAAQLAARIGLSLEQVRQIHVTGTLHDVGKIGVPDAILSKPGKLTDEERRIMETHPVLGEQIVRKAPQLAESLAGIRHHHERWDGAGYPDGLAGASIPLEARILALADTFDAMTSDRPYRSGMPVEKALRLIAAEAGAQFDPQLTEAFVAMLAETHVVKIAA